MQSLLSLGRSTPMTLRRCDRKNAARRLSNDVPLRVRRSENRLYVIKVSTTPTMERLVPITDSKESSPVDWGPVPPVTQVPFSWRGTSSPKECRPTAKMSAMAMRSEDC